MFKKLRLKNFKNFKDVQLNMGNLTILVGENASGKSNLRDAFRFIQGISRGYTLTEIIGEKWIEGGVLQWRGIRGGTREIIFQGESSFTIEIDFIFKDENNKNKSAFYKIEVDVSDLSQSPKIVFEQLYIEKKYIFDSARAKSSHIDSQKDVIQQSFFPQLKVRVKNPQRGSDLEFFANQTIISQIIEHGKIHNNIKRKIKCVLDAFKLMRFLDLNPDSMRLPSLPGQNILGEKGENLSSVLQYICNNSQTKEALIQWVEEFTPMEAVDFEFIQDQTGKILLNLVEKNNQKISAYSASDGTLRFLAIIANLLSGKPASFYFFEELENGIHPTRLNLLLQFIQRKVKEGNIQIIVTTHSSLLLDFLSEETLKYAHLTYRLENQNYAKITRILDIPEAEKIIKEQSLTRLHQAAWLENVMEFIDEENE